MGAAKKALILIAVLALLGGMYYKFDGFSTTKAIKQINIEIIVEKKIIKVNGNKIDTKTELYVDGDMVMIPLESILSSINGSYEFDNDEKRVTTQYNGIKVNTYIDSDYIISDNIKTQLDTETTLKQDCVFVTPKFFVAAFGFKLTDKKNSILLTKEFVKFADQNFEDYVKEITNKFDGDITSVELQKITNLELDGKNIKKIEGIEHFVNLKSLSLSNNQVTDVSALKSLKNLTDLNLSNNLITNISSLSGCEKLGLLNLSQNRISDIGELKSCKNLISVDLSKNRISQITLNVPPNLEHIDLSSNNIGQVKNPYGAAKLKSINLSYNPILQIDDLDTLKQLQNIYLWGLSSVDEVVREVGIVNQKSTELKKRLGLDKKSNLLKTTTIYDFVLYNSDYKAMDKGQKLYRENSNPIGILNRGAGDSSAMSQLIHILLKMEQIESYTYAGILDLNGKNNFHVWNIIANSKGFSYSDIGLGFMLGINNYGHAFFSVSDKQFLNTHPQGIERQFLAIDDSKNFRDSFFRGWSDYNGVTFDYFNQNIAKVTIDTKLKLIGSYKSLFITTNGKWIFYRNEDDEGKLYKIDVEGENNTKVNDDVPFYILNDDKNIYYINTNIDQNNLTGTICSLAMKDGKKSIISKNTNATWIALKNDKIFHKSVGDDKNAPRLFYVDTDGGNENLLCDDILKLDTKRYNTSEKEFSRDVILNRDQIFYSAASDEGHMYSIRINGKSRKKIADDDVKILEISNDYIYYKNINGYFRIAIDGSEKTSLIIGAY